MTTFAYLFRRDFDNPGDLYSCPMHYLVNENSGIMIDISQKYIPKIDVDVLIVGGGALFTVNRFVDAVEEKLRNINAAFKIVWGADLTPQIDPSVLDKYDMVGIRNTTSSKLWVPCASAMHPAIFEHFDKKPSKGILSIEHWKRPIDIKSEHTTITNKPSCIHTIVKEISEHEYVVTTSYHAAYWATLLKRKVIVIGSGKSFPTKFYGFRHPPIIAEEFDESLLDQAKVWDDAYRECIGANYYFRKQIEKVTGIDLRFRYPEFKGYSQ